MINKMNLNHSCGASCKDKRKHRYTSNLVRIVILQDVQDQPSLNPKDIRRKFKYEHDIELSYYFACAGKQMAMKYIYGDDSVFYHHLYSYMNQLIESNPNSYIVLQGHPDTQRFMRLFVSFGACIVGFNHCHPVIFLDGTFLKPRHQGFMLAATGKNGNNDMFFHQYLICVIFIAYSITAIIVSLYIMTV